MGKNWKTTAFSLITAAAGFVAFTPETFARWPLVIAIAKYVMVGGMAGIGIAAKDSTTHSTVAEVKEATAEEPK